MAARALLALVAVLCLAWLGVLVRHERVGTAAAERVFFEPGMARGEVDRQLERIESAELLNPDPHWRLQRASLLLQRDRRAEAAGVAAAVARDEPANLDAWSTLLRATDDPREAARAEVAITRWNPPVGRAPR